MKKILFLSLSITSFFTKAQIDTLSVSSTQLAFNNQNSRSYGDTLNFSYNLDHNGPSSEIGLKHRANVRNSQGWQNNVGDSIMVDTSVQVVNPSVNNRIQAGIILEPSTFKNGNNTVVIWPDNFYGETVTTDSIEFEVSVYGVESNGKAQISINDYYITNQTLVISNNSQTNQLVRITNLSGQLVKELNLNSNGNETLFLPKGIFLITVLEDKTTKSTKILVK